jgi:magnesium chelatase subunit D
VEDIKDVAVMALTHRKREAAPPPPPPPPEHDHEHDHDHEEEDQNEESREEEQQPEEKDEKKDAKQQESREEPPPDPDGQNEPEDKRERRPREDVMEDIFDVGDTFKVKKFASPKDRIVRRGSGRRSRTRISRKQGRYVKSTMGKERRDVALDATLRAAAPYQLERKNGNGNGLAVTLKSEDIREKIREKRVGNFLLFVVDASGSMGARGRMVASKGAIMSLLLDAYQKRDRIAMVSFRKEQAFLNLPPTSSIELAAGLLKEMPVGGKTPLSAGLVKSHEVLRNFLMKDPASRPIVIIVTDGKSNVSIGDRKPLDEVMDFAARLSLDDRVRFIVVDTESQGIVNFGLAHKLAGAMGAQYFKTEELKADTLLNIVKGEV